MPIVGLTFHQKPRPPTRFQHHRCRQAFFLQARHPLRYLNPPMCLQEDLR